MDLSPPLAPPSDWFMSGYGEAARLMRATDWKITPVGAVASWPSALQNTIGLMLNSRHPMFLWWGAELVQFYNDAYIPSFGVGKHPVAMGQCGADCWQEIWPIIWPQIDDVMRYGKPSWHEDQLIPIFRNGRIEDVYWTYGYSPVVCGDNLIGGTLVICSETTGRVVSHRRESVVRQFAEIFSSAAPDHDVALTAMEALLHASVDVPAALFYQLTSFDQPPTWLRWLGTNAQSLSEANMAVQRKLAELPNVLSRLRNGESVLLEGVIALTNSMGDEPITDMFLVPARGAANSGNEFIAYGINPRIQFDETYREFFVQLTRSISLAKTRRDASRIRALAETERNNLLMQAPVATAVLTGPDMVFQLANTLYCELVGRTDLLGKAYVEAFPELIPTEQPGILQSVFLTGVRYVSQETLFRLDRTGSGKLEDCYFEFNLEPMRNTNNEIYGLMAVAVDVTAQVAARQALERSNSERQSLLDQAEAASRAKDEFLAMLGHELRNPLSPIVTALHVMKLRSDGSTQKEQATIQRQVDHLVRLVDDLLDVSSVTRGKVQLKLAATPLSEVLARAVEMAASLLDERRHTLSLDIADPQLMWWGDASRLAQVVSNLLTNAARYTPQNGKIMLTAAERNDEIIIRVKDNGIGISADLLPRVFDLFFQGRRGTDRAEGGLGLGLALVKNLVSMHGGTAQAFSAGEGQGSEFVVRLPTSRGQTDIEERMTHVAASAEKPMSVLIVDDNRDAADSLAELLRVEGHSVRVAYQPLTGLALAEQFMPEVALLDIGLPGMDGYELAARFRERFDSHACKLIALTGYGQEGDRKQSAAAGFAAHLVKPVDFVALRAAMIG